MKNALESVLLRLGAQKDVPLKAYSTLRVGGLASFLVEPNSVRDVAEVMLACREHDVPWHILSGGSNTLFSDDGFLGVVIKLGPSFDSARLKDGLISVGARTSFAKVTKMAASLGWSTALGWCGTPGLIGGAIRMNAGTRMGEISDAILSVSGIKDGVLLRFSKSDIEFGYRSSSLPKDLIICEAVLGVDKGSIESPDLLAVKVDEYRKRRKSTQPTINSLGSFFKNPSPMFAGLLIEQCKLKGFTYNDAQISPLHANFIINNNNASAKDILKLASIAQKAVFEQFGIMLEPEVRMVGDFSHPIELQLKK